VWEKFEDKLKEAASQNKSAVLSYLMNWAKDQARQRIENLKNHEAAPLLYSVADSLFLSKIKAALGLD
jgi:long-subunit acyl-CoA synthetase (AMP-forming)